MERIQQITGGAFRIEEGALYPALHRLEHQGYLAGEWGVSDNNRRAKYYKLTTTGRKRLAEAMHNWNRLAKAMDLAFNSRPRRREMWARLRSFARMVFRRTQWERDLRDEFECHLEERADALERAGLTPRGGEAPRPD